MVVEWLGKGGRLTDCVCECKSGGGELEEHFDFVEGEVGRVLRLCEGILC